MKYRTTGTLAALTLMASATAGAEEKIVNVYNWSDYIDPAKVTQFENETGIKVNYDVYDSNEVLEAKLLAGGSGYDVVMPTASFLERQVKSGVYAEIDRSKLKNLGNIDMTMADKVAGHDPGNKHNVPYTWGTIGLGYNIDMVKARLGEVPVNSWDLIFKPEVAAKLADCGIGVLDSSSEVMAIALNYMGMNPNSEKKSDLKKASAMISKARPHYKYFHSSRYISDLANGDICVTLAYNGDVLQAQDRANEAGQGIRIDYTVPKEGSVVWFDVMAIPADAPHKDAAHKFIDFVLRPETGAAISNTVYFAVPNKAASTLLLDDVRTNPAIYPPAEVKQVLYTQNAHTAKYDRQLTRAWSNIKTGR